MADQTRNKPTPGPWSLLPARTLVNVKGPHGEQICQLPIGDPNAPLIAAAPDLLAELKNMIAAFNVAEVDPLVAFASIERARALVEKAEGED